jgi:hypothetical protein
MMMTLLIFAASTVGFDTMPKGRPQEYYMVHDEVWFAAGMTERSQRRSSDFLCIGCLEARLGRTLIRRDFADVPINQPDDHHHSFRLKARLLAM